MASIVEQKELYEEGVGVVKKSRFEVNQESLMDVLSVCKEIVPKSDATMPILQSVKFDLIENTLFITATDVTQSIIYQLEVLNTGGVNWSCLFPAKEGIELINRLPKKKLVLEKQEATLLVTYGNNKTATLRILEPDQFPALPDMEAVEQLSLPYETLRRASVGALFASLEESTPALLGMYIHCLEGKLAFSVTDRHRIFRYVSDVAILEPDAFSPGIIPAKSFRRMINSFKGAKYSNNYEIAMTNNYLIMRNPEFVYFGKLLDSTFPDLQRMFNATDEGKLITLPREELSETLHRALSLKTENNRITLEVIDRELVIHKASEDNEIHEEIPGAVTEDGDYPVLKLNGEFLKETLLFGDPAMKIIHMRFTGQRTPVYVTLEDDPSVLAILLPCI